MGCEFNKLDVTGIVKYTQFSTKLIIISRPPATVLSKPVVKRERRDSSDHEPSPPNSPEGYFVEDNTPSNITVSLKTS